jgi:hypothetical protein
VTFCLAVNSFSGSSQEVKYVLMSSSSDILPRDTSASATAAATGLLIDAA